MFKAGYLGYFALDNAAGSITNLQSYTDDVSVPQTVAMLDVSVLGTAPKAFIGGLSNGDTIPLKGPYDVTLHTHVTGLLAAQAAGTVSHSFIWGPGGSVASQAKVSGECLVANYQLSSGVGGRAEWTASLQISGAVTNGTF